MKNILLLLAITLAVATKAQVTKVYLQASGLTCSMCSNAINKALKTLDFVDKVDANLKDYTFEISFKPGGNVEFDKIRKKVEDAGFSVAGFVAAVYFDKVALSANQPVKIGSNTLVFINVKEQVLDGEVKIKLLDKGFVSSKEYKRTNLLNVVTAAGVYHVMM